MKKVISGFAEKVLASLCSGATVEAGRNGTWRIGRRTVPASVIENLERVDLVRKNKDRIEPTEAAQRYLARIGWQRSTGHANARPKRRRAKGATPEDPALSPWRAQHMIVRPGATKRAGESRREENRPLRNLAETPLAWFARHRDRRGRPFLDERLIAAGERLRNDFEMAGLRPRMTVTYSPVAGEGGRRPVPPDGSVCGRIDAHRRFTRALEAVGPGLGDILIEVCCFLNGLEAAERQLGWPQRAGKLVLKLALERLANHYEGRQESLSLSTYFTNMDFSS